MRPTDSDAGNCTNIFLSAACRCFPLSTQLLQCLFLLGNLLPRYYVINHIEFKSKGIQKKTPKITGSGVRALELWFPMEASFCVVPGITEPWEVSLPLLDPCPLSSEQSDLLISTAFNSQGTDTTFSGRERGFALRVLLKMSYLVFLSFAYSNPKGVTDSTSTCEKSK